MPDNLPFFIISAVTCIGLCLFRKTDIVETTESSSQILFLILISALWFLFSIFIVVDTFLTILSDQWWNLSKYWSPFTFPFIILPYFFIILLPIVFAFFSYINLHRYISKELLIEEPDKKSEQYKNIIMAVNKISKEIRLSSPPKLIFSQRNLSPLVISPKFNNIWLVLPTNLFKMIDNITKLIKDRPPDLIKSQLLDFILYHELSHIKNKDLLLATWTSVFVNSIKYYIFIFIPILLFYLLIYDIVLVRTSYSLIRFSIPLLSLNLLFIVASKRFIRKRQILADARTSINIDEDSFYNLTRPCLNLKDKAISALELFEILYTDESLKKFSRFKLYMNFPLKFQSLQIIDESMSERINFMKNKEFLSERRLLPEKDTIIWIGIFASVLIVSHGLFLDAYTESYIYEKYLFNTSFSIYRFLDIIIILIIIALVTIFVTPLRNSINNIYSMPNYILELFKSFFIIMISYHVATIIQAGFSFILLWFSRPMIEFNLSSLYRDIPFYSYSIFELFKSFSITGIFYSLFLFSMVGVVSFGITISKDIENIETFLMILMPSLVSATIMFITLFLILTTIFDKIKINLLLILIITNYVILFGFKLFDKIYLWKDLILIPIFNRKLIIYLYNKNYFKKILCYMKTVTIFILLPLTIPPFILYPFAHYLTSESKLYYSPGNYTYQNLHEYILTYLPILVVIALLLFFAYYFAVIRPKSIEKYLNYLYFAVNNFRVIRNLRINITQYSKEKIGDDIDCFRTEDGCFSRTIAKSKKGSQITNIVSTYFASQIISEYDIQLNPINCSWIIKCQNAEGGFGYIPNSHSFLETTYYALQILTNSNKIELASLKIHAVWILDRYQRLSYFANHSTSKPGLKDNYHALKSLQMLSAISNIPNIDEFAKSSEELWSKGKRTEEDTWYFINCLIILDKLSERIKENLKMFWIPLFSKRTLNTRIDKNLNNVFYFLSILKAIKVQDDYLINKLKDDYLKSEFFRIYQN